MRRTLTTVMGGAILGAAFCLSALGDEPPELKAGASLFWASVSDGMSTPYRERILHVGPDFELYASVDDGAFDDEISYFAVFSGIEFVACEDPMPSDARRTALANFFPLKAGAVLPAGTSDDAPAYTVGEASTFYLMGETYPTHSVKVTYADPEMEGETITLLDDLNVAAIWQWSADSADRLMLISDPSPNAAALPTRELLQNCAALVADL